MIRKIAVAGAGTMGSGIALAASQNGFAVILFDKNETVLAKARESVINNLRFLTDKNKITAEESSFIYKNILFTSLLKDCVADLVIEAIIEKMEAKTQLFRELSEINNKECIFASNTSSLSVSEIQSQIEHPHRVAGMHFFNPAHVMKLVEIVKGTHTSEEVVNQLKGLSGKLNKTAVVCIDSPGFIVNRVARHFYLEAMKLVELKVASVEEIDTIMEATGFKMGPFRLMDLIGMDINLAVSESLYNAMDKVPRLKPSQVQVDKVAMGDLGRKSGKGFYNY